MTDSSSPANSATVGDGTAAPRVDVQDPLPETDWFWRRTYTFTLTLVSLAMLWYVIETLWALKQAESLYRIGRYLIGVIVMLVTYYMVAPSAEQIIKIIQSAKLLRAGIPITRSASVETPQGGRAEVKTTAGSPQPDPAPVVPVPPVSGIDNLPEEAPWK